MRVLVLNYTISKKTTTNYGGTMGSVISSMQVKKFAVVTFSTILIFGAGAVSSASAATIPGDVQNLTVGTVSATSVALSWQAPVENSQNITDYVIESSKDNGSSWSIYNDGVSTQTSLTLTGLDFGTKYSFRVSAKNGSDLGSPVVANAAAVVSTAAYHTCEIDNARRVTCWGLNGKGEVGVGAISAIAAPTVISGVTDAVQITMGDIHTCVLQANGVIKCWGWNGNCMMCHYNLDSGSGVLGDGANLTRPYPVQVSGITNAVSIGSGYRHNCAILATGEVKCWGASTLGQFGTMNVSDPVLSPVTVPGLTGAVALAGAADSMCALMSDTTVKCWGNSVVGQLGNGYKGLYGNANKPYAVDPVTVTGLSGVIKIQANAFTTCAVKSNGHVYCWGSNFRATLGQGSTTLGLSAVPVEVPGISTAVDLGMGYATSCVLLADHTAKCWGDNLDGAFGLGTKTVEMSPVTIGVNNILAISSGMSDVCVLVEGGTIKCAGAFATGIASNPIRTQSTAFINVLTPEVKTLAVVPATIATPTITSLAKTSFYANFSVPTDGTSKLTAVTLKVTKTSDGSVVKQSNVALRGLTTGSAVSVKVSSLTGNTSYTVVATATNAIGTSLETNKAVVVTLAK